MIVDMTGQHRFDNRSYRPSVAEYEAAVASAAPRNLSLNKLIRAFLRLFAANPDRAIKLLGHHLADVEADTPKGRPRKPVDASRPSGRCPRPVGAAPGAG